MAYGSTIPISVRSTSLDFTDMMRGSGHGNGGHTDLAWFEVYGKSVPRGASLNSHTQISSQERTCHLDKFESS